MFIGLSEKFMALLGCFEICLPDRLKPDVVRPGSTTPTIYRTTTFSMHEMNTPTLLPHRFISLEV